MKKILDLLQELINFAQNDNCEKREDVYRILYNEIKRNGNINIKHLIEYDDCSFDILIMDHFLLSIEERKHLQKFIWEINHLYK